MTRINCIAILLNIILLVFPKTNKLYCLQKINNDFKEESCRKNEEEIKGW